MPCHFFLDWLLFHHPHVYTVAGSWKAGCNSSPTFKNRNLHIAAFSIGGSFLHTTYYTERQACSRHTNFLFTSAWHMAGISSPKFIWPVISSEFCCTARHTRVHASLPACLPLLLVAFSGGWALEELEEEAHMSSCIDWGFFLPPLEASGLTASGTSSDTFTPGGSWP